MDLQELYQQVIIDHSKKPRNFGKIAAFNREAEGFNPLCGDQLRLFLRMDGEKVADVSFEGNGCAISTASASMMTDALRGKTTSEVEKLFSDFHAMVISDPETLPSRMDALEDRLGKLTVFAGVCEFPSRVKCATLCWHTLHNAIQNKKEVTSTE